MGTRASIVIQDKHDTIFLYRGHDGYPSETLTDLQKTLDKYSQYLDDAVSIATWILWQQNQLSSTPDYELTSCCHGDEDYLYLIDSKTKKVQAYQTPSKDDWEIQNIANIIADCKKIEHE